MSGERRAGSAFWNGAISRFPSLKGAASTAYYLDCERLLIDTLLPSDVLRELSQRLREQGRLPEGVSV